MSEVGNSRGETPALSRQQATTAAARAPGLLWPVWGVALGAAALAYYHRRR